MRQGNIKTNKYLSAGISGTDEPRVISENDAAAFLDRNGLNDVSALQVEHEQLVLMAAHEQTIVTGNQHALHVFHFFRTIDFKILLLLSS